MPFKVAHFIFVCAFIPTTIATPILNCKITPSDAEWPPTATWQKLNDTVNGHLIRSTAPGAVCRPDNVLYSNTSCAVLQENWKLAEWHATNPVSVDYNDGWLWNILRDHDLYETLADLTSRY
jgi:hypothetical protein